MLLEFGTRMTGKDLNAFTVDVEDYFQVSALEGAISPADWDSIPSRVVVNTNRMLELLAEYHVNGTFFVLGWIAERFPDLVRDISNQGHEVACHGYAHRRIHDQDRDTFREETVRAKRILEDCIGSPVLGYRAASFSVTQSTFWALEIIAEAGFQYDSSIYPIWHDNYGIPGAKPDPSVLALTSGAAIAEFPMSTATFLGIPVPVGGGGYFRLYPYWLSRHLLRKAVEQGRSINFYCHPWEIDPHQPRVGNLTFTSRFRHYNNLGKFEDRLRNLLGEFKFATCQGVLQQYGLI